MNIKATYTFERTVEIATSDRQNKIESGSLFLSWKNHKTDQISSRSGSDHRYFELKNKTNVTFVHHQKSMIILLDND